MFVLHRLTGLVMTFYLFVHLVTLGAVLQGPDGFDRAMVLMSTPAARLLELALVTIVLFHTLNGLRLTILAVSDGSLSLQRGLAYGVVVLTTVAFLLSLPLFV